MHQYQATDGFKVSSILSPHHPAQSDHGYQPDESIEIETYTGEDVLFGRAVAIARARKEMARAGRSLKRAARANKSSWRLYRDSLKADLDQILGTMSGEETRRLTRVVNKHEGYQNYQRSLTQTMGFYNATNTQSQIRRCA